MANWLVVIDEDEARRAAYAASVEAIVAPIAGLHVASQGGAGWTAVWAVANTAPFSVDIRSKCGALLWGEARDTTGELQTAASIRTAWHGGAKAQWDGYYAAAVIEESERSLTVGSDLLGIFPIYYWTDRNGLVLVGTSPELFQTHPRFRADLDFTGLVGILLTNGLVNGQALWHGVKRLGPGRRLRVTSERVWEDEAYQIPSDLGSIELPLSGHVNQLADALSGAIKRHTPSGRSYGLLLSGGLDSRMIAGFMIRGGVKPRPLTLGLASDLEMRCSKAVANLYGLDHVAGEPEAADYPELACLNARWEHLANGFTTLRDWWTQRRVGNLGERLVTGLLADSLVGGTSLSWAYSDNPPSMSYENFVQQKPKLGVPPDVLRQLLRATEADKVIKEVERSLRDEFMGYSDRISYCAWRYDLAHGQRYHVGGTAWRLSFGSWPVLPMLDRQLIETVARMPAASLADRELQLALVETKLPELASLPLDRSDLISDQPQYLQPEARQLLADTIRNKLHSVRGLLSLGKQMETRYWYRINNFNGELWKRAREAAEPQRGLVGDIFDSELLRKILPSLSEKSVGQGPWVGESGRKLLLGFIYWAEHHLE
jgi:asparagine synthase (glutamine-hydrolysing)